jgi:hypothetical protein
LALAFETAPAKARCYPYNAMVAVTQTLAAKMAATKEAR